MPQYRNQNGVYQNASLALSYQDAETLEFFFLLGQPKDTTRSQKFIFPGGQVDKADKTPQMHEQAAYRLAAVRELEEETGIDLSTLNIPINLVGTEHSAASNGYPAKDIHFFSAHLGRLDRASVSTLSQALQAKDDLKNLKFLSQTTSVKYPNSRYMQRIAKRIKQTPQEAQYKDIAPWLRQMKQTKQPCHNTASSASPSHTSANQTSASLYLAMLGPILLIAAGIGILLLGLATSNPLGLTGAAPLLVGLGLFKANTCNTNLQTEQAQQLAAPLF